MGYSIRHEDKFVVKNRVGVPPVVELVDMDDQERRGWWSMEEEEEERRPVVEKKVHHQIQKLRAEDSKLGVDIREVLVSGKYRIVGGDDAPQHVASVLLFSRPASPLGGKTPLNNQACLLNQ